MENIARALLPPDTTRVYRSPYTRGPMLRIERSGDTLTVYSGGHWRCSSGDRTYVANVVRQCRRRELDWDREFAAGLNASYRARCQAAPYETRACRKAESAPAQESL